MSKMAEAYAKHKIFAEGFKRQSHEVKIDDVIKWIRANPDAVKEVLDQPEAAMLMYTIETANEHHRLTFKKACGK